MKRAPQRKPAPAKAHDYEMVIAGNPNNLVTVRDFIARAAKTCKLTAAATDDVIIAVDEACSNIIEHNYSPRTRDKKNIAVHISRAGAILTVTIKDEGKPFNPLTRKLPNVSRHLKDLKSRGMGIYLMSHLMDSLEHSYENGGNVLVMKKKISCKKK